MTATRFPLHRLLELKRRLLKHAERDLQTRATQEKNLQAQLELARREVRQHTTSLAHGDPAGGDSWRLQYQYLRHLEARIAKVQAELTHARDAWHEARNRYQQLRNETESLDSLSAQHAQRHREAERREEQRETDQFVLRRWQLRHEQLPV